MILCPPTLGLICALVALLSPSPHSFAQEIQFELQLLEMKSDVADFLEKRLLEGGDPAIEAGNKLPKLIANGTIKSVETLAFSGKDGGRSKSRSSGDVLAQPGGGTIPEGFDIEIEPNTGSDGAIHLNYALTHATKGRIKSIRTMRVQSSVALAPDGLNFLQRFHSGREELVLVAKAINPAAAPATESLGSRHRLVHAQVTLYKVDNIKTRDSILKDAISSPEGIAAALEKSAKLVDSIGTTIVPGQRQRVRHSDMRFEKQEGMVYDDGITIEFEPITGVGGKRIDVVVQLEHYSLTGKRAKTAGGVRTNERQRIHSTAAREIDSGQLVLFPCERQLIPAEGASEPAAYILAVRASSHGTFAPSSKPPSPIPASTDPDAKIIRSYQVPPSFLRRLQEKFPPPPRGAGLVSRFTAKETLTAAGIDFSPATSATFISGQSEIVLRHQRGAHEKLEKLLSEHPH